MSIDPKLPHYDMQLESQPIGTHFQNYVLPDNLASITLSGGRTIPYHYYLGSNNLCPFVQLVAPNAQKEISWGETVTLQPGQVVSVRNVSFMPGDLQIQSGNIPPPRPRRITIPVQIVEDERANTDPNPSLTVLKGHTLYPCDTRMAKRAYVNFTMNDTVFLGGTPPLLSAVMYGRNKQHSDARGQNQFSFNGEPYTYIDVYSFGEEFPPMIPLGTSIHPAGMRLADFVDLRFSFTYTANPSTPAPTFGQALYVIEY
jgi:hypothetical protein